MLEAILESVTVYRCGMPAACLLALNGCSTLRPSDVRCSLLATDRASATLPVSLLWLAPECSESEALLGDAEAAAGEAALAEHAYRSSVARGVHSASRALAGGLLVRGRD